MFSVFLPLHLLGLSSPSPTAPKGSPAPTSESDSPGGTLHATCPESSGALWGCVMKWRWLQSVLDREREVRRKFLHTGHIVKSLWFADSVLITSSWLWSGPGEPCHGLSAQHFPSCAGRFTTDSPAPVLFSCSSLRRRETRTTLCLASQPGRLAPGGWRTGSVAMEWRRAGRVHICFPPNYGLT